MYITNIRFFFFQHHVVDIWQHRVVLSCHQGGQDITRTHLIVNGWLKQDQDIPLRSLLTSEYHKVKQEVGSEHKYWFYYWRISIYFKNPNHKKELHCNIHKTIPVSRQWKLSNVLFASIVLSREFQNFKISFFSH